MKKSLSILFVGLLTVSLTACEKPVQEDAQTVIDNAWQKLASKNAEYTMGSGSLEGSGQVQFGENQGSVEADVDFAFDSSDEESPKLQLDLELEADGSFEGQQGSANISLEMKSLEEKTYFFLKTLGIDSSNQQINGLANAVGVFLSNKWYSVPNSANQLQNNQQLLDAETLMSKRIAELSKEYNFFEVKEDLGNRKYEVMINPEKLQNYLVELSKLTGEDISQADLAEVEQFLNDLDYTLQVKISNDYDLEWVKGEMNIVNPENSDEVIVEFEGNLSDDKTDGKFSLQLNGATPGSVSFDFTAEHDEESVTIEAPADAQEFDPNTLFEFGGAGLGAPAGTTPGLEGLITPGL